MIRVEGKAKIEHISSGEVYVIDSGEVEIEIAESHERAMGSEILYSVTFDHSILGELRWSIWEYPIGAHNHEEIDVGPHTLLEDFGFSFGENDIESVDNLVRWFFENFEDPVHRLPYNGREGGYQWLYGGPFNAYEELYNKFPDTPNHIISEAVEEIESGGNTDWAPVQKPGDYGEHENINDNDASTDNPSIQHYEKSIKIKQLIPIISKLPTSKLYPTIAIGEDRQFHILESSVHKREAFDFKLISELRDLTNSLKTVLAGTNAHTFLYQSVEVYSEALNMEQIDIFQLYARGVRLENVKASLDSDSKVGDIPPLPINTEQHLNSLLQLHGTVIMSHEDGKELVKSANEYRLLPEDERKLENAVSQITESVFNCSSLFGEDVKRCIKDLSKEIGKGQIPERSNQIASVISISLLLGVVNAIVDSSVPGMIVNAAGVELIDSVWHFLSYSASSFLDIIGFAFGNTTWFLQLSEALKHIGTVTKTEKFN